VKGSKGLNRQLDFKTGNKRKPPINPQLIVGGGNSKTDRWPTHLAQHISSMPAVADCSIIALLFRSVGWRTLTEFKKATEFIGYGVGAAN